MVSEEIREINAILTLLSLGIKSVPQAVLRKQFSETCEIMMGLLERFIESDNQIIVRNVS